MADYRKPNLLGVVGDEFGWFNVGTRPAVTPASKRHVHETVKIHQGNYTPKKQPFRSFAKGENHHVQAFCPNRVGGRATVLVQRPCPLRATVPDDRQTCTKGG